MDSPQSRTHILSDTDSMNVSDNWALLRHLSVILQSLTTFCLESHIGSIRPPRLLKEIHWSLCGNAGVFEL